MRDGRGGEATGQVVRANLKKRVREDERLAEIETENARLLHQMIKIMDSPDVKHRMPRHHVTCHVRVESRDFEGRRAV